ncbi:MAG TPA: type II toxin-antitoxin system prevent-host-death family antitoxin [Actinoplanes sp.]
MQAQTVMARCCDLAATKFRAYSFLYKGAAAMKMINYTQARQNLAAVMDSVIDDAEEVVVHRSGHEPVVIVSLAEWESMRETEYLLGNPAMAQRLRESISHADAGEVEQHELIDPETLPGQTGAA